MLYLLFDTIHLFKNLRNSWVTEKMKKLHYNDPLTNEDMFAEFKDIIAIFLREKDLIVRQTKLTYSTVYDTNFDKQKVDLMLNLFNEKTAAVLELDGLHVTAKFVIHVSRLFNMFNVKVFTLAKLGMTQIGSLILRHSIQDLNLLVVWPNRSRRWLQVTLHTQKKSCASRKIQAKLFH